jgi:hypothetical protein
MTHFQAESWLFILMHVRSLKSLQLGLGALEDVHVLNLAVTLKGGHSRLASLSIDFQQGFSAHHVAMFIKQLADQPALQALALTSTSIAGRAFVDAFTPMGLFHYAGLRSVDFSGWQMDAWLFDRLGQCLRTWQLKTLQLAHNQITGTAWSKFTQPVVQSVPYVKLPELVSLDLSWNPIGDEDIVAFTSSFKQMPALKTLKLAGTCLTRGGWSHVLVSLKELQSLTHFVLSPSDRAYLDMNTMSWFRQTYPQVTVEWLAADGKSMPNCAKVNSPESPWSQRSDLSPGQQLKFPSQSGSTSSPELDILDDNFIMQLLGDESLRRQY